MSVVSEYLSAVTPGEPVTYRNLTLFPLLGDGPAEPDYLLLDAALAAGQARVTEVSDAGSVPELAFDNHGDRSVLLLDGEELVGAKQNRILNLSVLAPPGKRTVIPVSCVEAGRWQALSAELTSARRAHFAGGRARKAAQVSASLRSLGSPRGDQSAVWADIESKAGRMGAKSATSAAAALYETHRGSLDDYLGAFSAVPAQRGAVFVLNGRVLGLDLFDSPATLDALLPKLVESCALDALDALGDEPADTPEQDGPGIVQRFLASVGAADLQRFQAIGEGQDLRISRPGLSGGALVKDVRVIHLCAFETADPGADDEGHRPRGSRIVRVTRRARGPR
jgi:hypothetical protein